MAPPLAQPVFPAAWLNGASSCPASVPSCVAEWCPLLPSRFGFEVLLRQGPFHPLSATWRCHSSRHSVSSRQRTPLVRAAHSSVWSGQRTLLVRAAHSSVWSGQRTPLVRAAHISVWSGQRTFLVRAAHISVWSGQRTLLLQAAHSSRVPDAMEGLAALAEWWMWCTLWSSSALAA